MRNKNSCNMIWGRLHLPRYELAGMQVVLDKMETEGKRDRTILISAYAIQLFSDKGGIRRQMTEDDIIMIKRIISTPKPQ